MQWIIVCKRNGNIFESMSKIGIFLFCFYLFWFRDVISYNNLLFYGSAFIALLGTVLDIFSKGGTISSDNIPNGWLWWLVFGAYCLVSSLVFSIDPVHSLDALIRFFSYLLMSFVICYITYKENSFDWFLKIFIIVTLVCCVHMVLKPYQIYYSRFSLGPNNNPNSLATTVFFGLFCVLFRMKTNGKRILASMILVVLCLYSIMLANSRKIIFASLFITFIWFVYYLKALKKGKLTLQKLAVYGFIVIAVACAGVYFVTNYFGSVLGMRMSNFIKEDSNTSRFYMYKESFEFFIDNPMFGIGFDCFRLKSTTGLYSHTTYGEAIACTGMIGTVLFFSPIIKTATKSVKSFIKNKTYWNCLLLALLICELFLAFGQILFYEVDHMFFFMLIFMYMEENHQLVYAKNEV